MRQTPMLWPPTLPITARPSVVRSQTHTTVCAVSRSPTRTDTLCFSAARDKPATLRFEGQPMTITAIVPQLRTTDMASSIRFYTEELGFSVAFKYQDFYTGIRAGDQIFHLKLVDEKDPSIPYVDEGEHFHLYLETDDVADLSAQLKAKGVKLVKDVHETPWNTREIVIHDDQGIRCISVNLRSHSVQSRDEMSPPLAKS